MSFFKAILIQLNFHKSFFENDLILPFYDKIYNKTDNQYFLNTAKAKIDQYKNKIVTINFIPPFFDLKLNQLNNVYNYYKVQTHVGFLIDLKNFESINKYLKFQFGISSRYKLRRALKKLEKCFDINYRMYYGDIDLANYNFLLDELELMIKKRFSQRKEKHGHLGAWSFYKETTYALILDKKASLFVVYDGNKPIAMVINYLRQNIFEYGIPSYDINYAKFGIGNIVILKELEWCFKNQFQIMDMGWGDLWYKRKWCNSVYKYETHILFKKNQWYGHLIAYLFSKLIVFKIHLRNLIINPIKKKIVLFKRKIGTKYSSEIIQKKTFEKSDIAISKNAIKLEYNKKEFAFLLKHIFDFQYSNSEHSKNIEVYKIDESQNSNSFIISGKSKMEKIVFT
ncbi:GNAT family N-acetyltransferase [Flavobacteriaceae bacterium XHP0103]|uniref:GNAT family N-acetyltransferase n=1 Tax=Marixanthotalea marina TaxID=2844359 RepID=UPI002989F632|nr:GNAT family N-acetyltransferase [Marixanthotalea marina]MBU3822307.1 GNAT family N-acetyltransferase [Marixanthotalea marina]